MSWVAIFLDGPLQGREHDRMFMGSWQDVLHFAPLPMEIAASSDGWVLVGLSSFDDGWPGQVTYTRDDSRSQLLEDIPAGENEGWAAYRMVKV